MGNFDDLPGRGRNHEIEDQAEAAFSALIAESENFILQRADRKDYGTDCQVEILHQGHPTNVRLHIQLKGSERDLNADGSLSISVKRTNFNYLFMQPYSHYVAYHLPTKSLIFSSVESVFDYYEHNSDSWTDKDSLTVNFIQKLTLGRLEKLANLAHYNSKMQRNQRLIQIGSIEKDFLASLISAAPLIHVPDDINLAIATLERLYEKGADLAISNAFDQFAAILGLDGDAIGSCYMAEINLGMAGKSQFPERIKTSITYFEKKITSGRFQVGSLQYTIGNAHSALGNEQAAMSSYQAAAADMDFMSDQQAAAMCLKNLGSSFEQLGNDDTAAELYRGSLSMNPQLPEAHLALARFYHRIGEFDQALEHYDATIFAKSDLNKNATVIGWRINVLFNLEEVQEAFRNVNQLLAEAEQEKWVWQWCGQQIAAFGRTSIESARRALVFWQRYLDANSACTSARIEFILTKLYLRQKFYDTETSYLDFRIQFDDCIEGIEVERTALLWDRLGHCAQDEGKWEEAEHCFRQAHKIDGGHYGYCLGVALNFLARYEEALPLVLEQATEIQPDELSWFQVGIAKEKLGQIDGAVEAYRQVLIFNPNYSLAMFNMAGALWNYGRHGQAEIIFRTAAQQFPDDELTIKLHQEFPHLFQ